MMRIRILDPESFRPWFRAPGWKKFGSGINIPALKHCFNALCLDSY